MKVYLDTNMLYFLLLKNNEDISPAVSSILGDYQTVLCTSSVCAHELIHLCHIGKVPVGKKNNDRLIIGQAISDKVLLVSSDHKFERYVKYGLNFIFNKR